MKKFDFVAELLAHGFHDDTKLEAVELSRQTGFEGVVLSRDFTIDSEGHRVGLLRSVALWNASYYEWRLGL